MPLESRYVYPDLTVVCGKAVFKDDDADTPANPTLIVEVLSPTTENDDRDPELFGSDRSLRNAYRSQILAAVRSRLTVITETSRTAVISSRLRPR